MTGKHGRFGAITLSYQHFPLPCMATCYTAAEFFHLNCMAWLPSNFYKLHAAFGTARHMHYFITNRPLRSLQKKPFPAFGMWIVIILRIQHKVDYSSLRQEGLTEYVNLCLMSMNDKFALLNTCSMNKKVLFIS